MNAMHILGRLISSHRFARGSEPPGAASGSKPGALEAWAPAWPCAACRVAGGVARVVAVALAFNACGGNPAVPRAPESSSTSGGSGESTDSAETSCFDQRNQQSEKELSITLRNGKNVPLYLWSGGECGLTDYKLIELRRGLDIVDINPNQCHIWCEEYVGVGMYIACQSACIMSMLIRVEPGATWTMPPITNRIIRTKLASSCVGGQPAQLEPFVGCSRQLPLLESTYTASAFALTAPDVEGCFGSNCRPDANGTCVTEINCSDEVAPASIVSATTTFNFPTESNVTITLGGD